MIRVSDYSAVSWPLCHSSMKETHNESQPTTEPPHEQQLEFLRNEFSEISAPSIILIERILLSERNLGCVHQQSLLFPAGSRDFATLYFQTRRGGARSLVSKCKHVAEDLLPLFLEEEGGLEHSRHELCDLLLEGSLLKTGPNGSASMLTTISFTVSFFSAFFFFLINIMALGAF